MSTETTVVVKSWNDLPKSDRSAIVFVAVVIAVVAVVVIRKKILESTKPVQIEATNSPEKQTSSTPPDQEKVHVRNVSQIFITNMKFNERRN